MPDRTVRALYLQPAASFGGAERQAAQNIKLLPRYGIEVLPLVGPGREIVEFLEDAGVRRYVFRADLPHDPKAPRDALARAQLLSRYVRAFFNALGDIERQARRFGAHLVFASRPFAWVAGGMAAARLSLPTVWRVGTHFEHWLQPAVLSCFAQRRPPRAVVCTSAAIRHGVASALAAPAFVVHNGVDTERFSPARPVRPLRGELGLPDDAKVLAFVGRIAPEKGTQLLVAGCQALAARVPGVQLLVAGDSGWRSALERAFAARGLSGSVRLLGFVREVERVYASADVVVSTSEAEGCPNAVLEAMAMGRAVVATNVGGTGEVLRDGIDGLLVPPGSPEGFARAVESLLALPSRRRALGLAAARRVAERFSLDGQVARLAHVIRWSIGHPLGAGATAPAAGEKAAAHGAESGVRRTACVGEPAGVTRIVRPGGYREPVAALGPSHSREGG